MVSQRVKIDRQRVASAWRGDLRLICRLKIVVEGTTLTFHLRGFEPVHVIIDVAHSHCEFLASTIQVRQALGDSSSLPARKQRGSLLVLTRHRTQNRMRDPNKQQ